MVSLLSQLDQLNGPIIKKKLWTVETDLSNSQPRVHIIQAYRYLGAAFEEGSMLKDNTVQSGETSE